MTRHWIQWLKNLGRKVRILANERAEELELIGCSFFPNEFPEDGYVQLAPYGNWPNAGGMQRFLKPDADAIVADFRSLTNTVSRPLGLPFYVGHPDHERFASRYPDTRAYGRVKELEARDDGLYGKVKWSKAGRELVNEGMFHGHSVNWKVRKDGEAWRPFSLKSVGFTNEPNIPVKPILAANEKDNSMIKKLIALLKLNADASETDVESRVTQLANAQTAWLKKMGKESATEAEVLTFINESMGPPFTTLDHCNAELAEMKKKYAANEGELATSRSLALALQGQITSLTNERATLQTQVGTATANVANERKSVVGLLLDGAITAGRITLAERKDWETQLLGNEFEVAKTKLGGLKPKLNTTSMVNGRTTQGVIESTDRMAKHQEEVSKIMANEKVAYDEANARFAKRNPNFWPAKV